jgi:hypothetical protein
MSNSTTTGEKTILSEEDLKRLCRELYFRASSSNEEDQDTEKVRWLKQSAIQASLGKIGEKTESDRFERALFLQKDDEIVRRLREMCRRIKRILFHPNSSGAELEEKRSGQKATGPGKAEIGETATGFSPDRWQMAVLLGEIESVVRKEVKGVDNNWLQEASDVLRNLWQKCACRIVIEKEDLPETVESNQRIPDRVFDQLFEALLWRVPRPPSCGIHGGTIGEALQVRLGEEIPTTSFGKRIQVELPGLVEDWKRCCYFTEEMTRGTDGNETDGNERTLEYNPVGSSDKGIDWAEDVGVFQTLRVIRAGMQVGRAEVGFQESAKVLHRLLGEVSATIVKTYPDWKATYRKTFGN